MDPKLKITTEKIKHVDYHHTEPFVLCACYDGSIRLYNHITGQLVRSLDVSSEPLRACKFIERMNWFIVGGDDHYCRIFDLNTLEKVVTFEAALDYVRCIEVHPTKPFILVGGDDRYIRCFDWEKKFQCICVHTGHMQLVMAISLNPHDDNIFMTGSFDDTAMIWMYENPDPLFTLKGHNDGINAVAYCYQTELPYVATGCEDGTVKIWDYQTRKSIKTLSDHSSVIEALSFHPTLPLLLTTGDDGKVIVYNVRTLGIDKILSPSMGIGWSISCLPDTSNVCIGLDQGVVVYQLKDDNPVAVMDNTGRVTFISGRDVFLCETRRDRNPVDGRPINSPKNQLGVCDVNATSLVKKPKGKVITAIGDNDFHTYTALKWRLTHSGTGRDVCYSTENDVYAVLSMTKILICDGHNEILLEMPLTSRPSHIFGGPCLCVVFSDYLTFYDWDTLEVISEIDVEASNVVWTEEGDLVAIVGTESTFVLEYDGSMNANEDDEEELEDPFTMIQEIDQAITSLTWIDSILIFVIKQYNRLAYWIGGDDTHVIQSLDGVFLLLGYLKKTDRIYLINRKHEIVSYYMPFALLKAQECLVEEDIDGAIELIENVPDLFRNSLAQTFANKGFYEAALKASIDLDLRFRFAKELNDCDLMIKIAEEMDMNEKWNELGNYCLKAGLFDVAERSFVKCNDISALYLLYSSLKSKRGLEKVCLLAEKSGEIQILFSALHLLNEHPKVVELLLTGQRYAEATFYASNYAPELIEKCVNIWKKTNNNVLLPETLDVQEQTEENIDKLSSEIDNEENTEIDEN
eukprot:TRINITY_DN3079_c2_g1_i1.p1 TRINITY_DN3079_c2_g1~~TRINITY_DN3079_c2_g1_i1.p1  ORF type:complete len:803 (+),score=235.25 TRINITY_DN3079_c2_g1_i1:39-2447(+)